ncbi:MAG: hypothetical protein ACXAE3_14975, partial [Candidatus Kariarchaeaceae archaeon]
YGSEEGSIEFRYLFQTFLLPMFVRIGWVLFILQIPNLDSFLISTYLENVQSTISFSYPSAVLPEQVVIEHGPQTSFLISLLFIFTGVSFSPHLLLFKIDGLRKLSSFGLIFRWFLGYMLLYFAYFSDVSARYLVPVMPILAIAIGISVNTFISRIQRNEVKKFIVLVLYGSGILFIAPLLPIRIHRDGITTFFFYFHQEFIVLIIYLVLMILLFHKVVSKMQIAQLKWVKIANSAFVIILLVPTIIAPVSVQTYAILTDTPEEELSSYYYRESFQEVVSYLNSIQLGLDELVLSAITPGLSYFLRHPVLDVHMISGVRAFSTDLKEMTTDEAINFVQQYKIRLIVQVANTSLSYGYYQQFYQEIALMQVVNTLPSTLVFFTQEYVVYQLME